MKKILLLIIAASLIACAFGCSKNNEAPVANVKGVSKDVAKIDGLSISKSEYQTYLHNNFGDKAITALAEQKILEAWAKEEGVTPTKEQIDKEIQKLKDEGQYEDALEQIGESGLNQLIMDQLLRTNLSKKLNPPTEAEIKEGFEGLKSEYKHDARKQAFIILAQNKEGLTKVYDEVKDIKDPAQFEKKAKEAIKKIEGDKAPKSGTLWVSKESGATPEEINKDAEKLNVGDCSQIGTIKGQGPELYYVIMIKKAEDKVDKKLEEVKDDVTDKVALYNTMTKPDFQEAFQKRKDNAKIEIFIPKYADLAEQIKAPQFNPNMMAPAPAPAPKEEKSKKK